MSNERGNDELIVNIDGMLSEIPDAPARGPSIYRVSESLSRCSSNAYHPLVIAIGPLHHGNPHLKHMLQQKRRYLKNLIGDSSVHGLVKALREKEKAARDCYAEEITLGSDDFVQMLLLDAIFIIKFLRQGDLKSSQASRFGNVTLILRDLMLFENQIPLFILKELFNLSKKDDSNVENFNHLIWPFLPKGTSLKDEPMNADHLLGLVHNAATSSFSKNLDMENNDREVVNIPSASELKEAGLVFKKVENKKDSSWLDIKFENKIIYFPALEISDVTESWFKNMIALECDREQRCVTDYAFFLHCLVQSSKDAELLRREGIIKNLLGGDAKVYELIERLGSNAQPSRKFSYCRVFRRVNDHCGVKWNWWMAVLRNNQLSTPWTIISLIAAVILLSTGVVQMVYSILSYHDPHES